MSYEVTATKERPHDFTTLAGQEFVVSTLKNAIDTDRIAHAYLFSGPRGVGKTSSARILARALNCETGPTGNPCGVCSNCENIQAGNSIDVIEIDGASNTSVNDIRTIKDEVQFAPNASKFKIYIIDEVHMLSNSAFNALLKTIEEPPEYIIFIFATTEIHKVPATIRSRCQQFNFRLIPTETIQSLLAKISKENGILADDDALFWIAKEATGSLRDAYTLYDQVVAFSNNVITLAKIREKLGLVGLDQINDLITHAINKNRELALIALDSILMSGISAEQFIIDLTEYFRSLLLIKSGIRRETLLGSKPDAFNQEAIQKLSPTQIEAAISYLLNLYRNIRFSLSQRFELELLVSKLCELTSFFSHRELLHLISHIKKELIQGTPPQEAENATKPAPFTLPKIDSPIPTAHPTLQSNQPINDEPQHQHQPKTQIQMPSNIKPEVNPLTVTNPDIAAQFNASDHQAKIDAVIKAVNHSRNAVLVSALTNANAWEFQNNDLILYVSEPYYNETITRNLKEVSSLLSQLAGRPFSTQVILQKKSSADEVEEDEGLQLAVKVFQGQIVDENEI